MLLCQDKIIQSVSISYCTEKCYEADSQKPAGDNVSQPNPQERRHLQESRAANEKYYTRASQEQDHIEKVLPGAK
jgi:hypothetical protein